MLIFFVAIVAILVILVMLILCLLEFVSPIPSADLIIRLNALLWGFVFLGFRVLDVVHYLGCCSVSWAAFAILIENGGNWCLIVSL